MLKKRYIPLLLVCLTMLPLLSFADNFAQAEQTIALSFPKSFKTWKLGDTRAYDAGTAMTFIPSNEEMANWNEAIRTTTTSYQLKPYFTAKKLMLQEAQMTRQSCRKVDLKILNENAKSVTYQINALGCDGNMSQFQVGKIFNGVDAVYSARYFAMGGAVDKHEFNTVSHVIQKSTLVANPSYHPQ